jgi:hypothetical protein
MVISKREQRGRDAPKLGERIELRELGVEVKLSSTRSTSTSINPDRTPGPIPSSVLRGAFLSWLDI